LDLKPSIPGFVDQTEGIKVRWKSVCEHKMDCHWYVDQRGEPSYNMMGACQLLCGASIADVYDSCSPLSLVENAKKMSHLILLDLKAQYEPIPFRRAALSSSMQVPGAYSLMVLYDEEARMLELGIDRIGRMEFGKLEIAKKSESQEAEESISDDEEDEDEEEHKSSGHEGNDDKDKNMEDLCGEMRKSDVRLPEKKELQENQKESKPTEEGETLAHDLSAPDVQSN
jgi:hypothetical protein